MRLLTNCGLRCAVKRNQNRYEVCHGRVSPQGCVSQMYANIDHRWINFRIRKIASEVGGTVARNSVRPSEQIIAWKECRRTVLQTVRPLKAVAFSI